MHHVQAHRTASELPLLHEPIAGRGKVFKPRPVERETLVPAGFFERLLAALDAPDEIPVELQALARRTRAFERG